MPATPGLRVGSQASGTQPGPGIYADPCSRRDEAARWVREGGWCH
jgi:hypothetical protein